jgi:hypothetical protein
MLSCLLPVIFILNTDSSVIVTLHKYRLPDPHVDVAADLCRRKVGTCPVSVHIKPNGHLHIICKRRTNDKPN